MNCTREMIPNRKGRPISRARCNVRRDLFTRILSFFVLLVECSLKKIKSGVTRPLISAGALLIILGVVGGMERGMISPFAALPICLFLILGTLAIVKE
ncbi:MAG: hypothetical protein GX303_07790 [Clostridiales bacterium]|nr:hypothetical protein [Clostridiales bacterium]